MQGDGCHTAEAISDPFVRNILRGSFIGMLACQGQIDIM
jgi:hypothetical protein